VGILVNEFNPEVGGAHNFVQAVASALPFGKVENRCLELVFLIENRNKKLNSNLTVNVRRSPWIEARLLDAYRYSASKSIFRLLNFLNPMSKSIRQNNLDFIFFLGSSPIPTSIPFGIIVWDVQHRTHPWFPELQPGWSSRDELYSYVLPRASIVITGTNVGRNELVSLYGVYEKNIYIIPHPVPADVPEYSQTKSSEGFQFLYPAQFWPHKNHVVILEAMNKLRQQKKLNFKVVFAGSDKGNLPYIEELISEYKLTGFIEVKGFVPRSELLSLYQSCNALVYSSFSGPENLPPLEAFRSSLPVLYADFPGAREQLGQAALFFNPTDENDLAEKFLSIVNDLEMREKLISEGRLQLQGRTSSDFARKLIGVLESFSRIRRVWK
jgi:glycosyltransferase involved in cell wall biosynthesis